MPSRMGIKDHTAAKGLHGGIKAKDIAIAVLDDHRLFKSELDICLLTGRELVRSQKRDPADGFLSTVIESDTRPGLEAAWRLFEQVELRIKRFRWREEPGAHDRITAGELVFLHALEINGRALTGNGALNRQVMRLDAADFCFDSPGEYHDLLLRAYRAGEKGAGNDRAEAFHREDAVDRQAQDAVRRLRLHLVRKLGKLLDEDRQVLPSLGRDGNDRRFFEERAF